MLSYSIALKKQLRLESRHQIEGNDWTLLISEFGEKAAKQFRDACIQYWRGFDPLHWRDRGEFYWRTVGLAGLAFESFSNSDWTEKLSKNEISRAVVYAIFDSQGFSDWFPALYSTHFSAVRDVILAEAKHELSSDFKGEHSVVLQKMYFDKSFDATLLVPDLLQLVEGSSVDAVQNCVQYTLGLLLKNDLTDEDQARLSLLASSRFSVTATRSETLLWLNVFFAVDAIRGIENLEIFLKSSSGTERENIASQFFEGLTEGASLNMHTKYADYKHIEILGKLVPIAFKNLNPKEDLPFKSGKELVSRDYAQRAREGLLRLVTDTKGAQSYCLLEAWAKDPIFSNIKDWLLQQAKNRAEMDAEIFPWVEADIPEFFGCAERAPRNEYDLFHLAVGRLLELKSELEDGDDSVAQTVRRAEKETELRNWFARELRVRSHSKYEVPQEEEMSDGKRTDFRFHLTGVQPVPIELKIAEKWSYNEMVERLENQLVKQYMQTSKYGVFLLVYCSPSKKSWHGGSSYSFVELVRELNRQARKLESKYEAIEELRVIGIDLMVRDNY